MCLRDSLDRLRSSPLRPIPGPRGRPLWSRGSGPEAAQGRRGTRGQTSPDKLHGADHFEVGRSELRAWTAEPSTEERITLGIPGCSGGELTMPLLRARCIPGPEGAGPTSGLRSWARSRILSRTPEGMDVPKMSGPGADDRSKSVAGA